MKNRAYSLIEVKSVDEEQRIIRGIATTPTLDRIGDVVDPMGAVIRGSINLFLYHNTNLPVGSVDFGRPTKKEIPFEAQIPDVREDGTVRDRVNEAWHSVKYRLLRAVSIGFNIIDDGVELLKNGGLLFTKWEMLELSLVGVPANPDAVITAFKSANPAAIRDALGVNDEPCPWRMDLIRSLKHGAVPLVTLPQQKMASGAVRLVSR
jgi:prohead serine protease